MGYFEAFLLIGRLLVSRRTRSSSALLRRASRYGAPFREGDRWFYWYNTGLQNQHVLYTKKNVHSEEAEVFLDPNKWSEDGTSAVGRPLGTLALLGTTGSMSHGAHFSRGRSNGRAAMRGCTSNCGNRSALGREDTLADCAQVRAGYLRCTCASASKCCVPDSATQLESRGSVLGVAGEAPHCLLCSQGNVR